MRFTLLLILIFSSFTEGQIFLSHQYTMVNGLVSDNINAICQDSSGYLWIATGEGVSVFDSKEFVNYRNTGQMSSDNITCIATDRRDGSKIWMGTYDAGAMYFSGGKFTPILDGLTPKQKSINTIYIDRDDIPWFGTGSSIFFIKNDSVIAPANTLGIKEVNSICGDGNNKILIGARNGLFLYDKHDKIFEKLSFPLLGRDYIISAIPEGSGTILVLTRYGTLFRIKEKKISRFQISKIGEFTHIIPIGNTDDYWITSDHGLYKINLKGFKRIVHFTKKNGLAGDNINFMFTDREGVLWFGTNGKGVFKIPRTNLLKFEIPESVKNVYNVQSVMDINGHIWTITSDRLIEFWKDKFSTWRRFTHLRMDLDSKGALAKFYLSHGSKLIITYNRGLVKEFDIENKNPLSDSPSKLVSSSTEDLTNKYKFYELFLSFEDNHGYLWISAIDLGVVVMSKSKPRRVIKIYTDKSGLPDNSIRCIYQDKEGNYWFGGYDKGLAFFSKDKVRKDLGLTYSRAAVKIKKYTEKNGMSDNSVRAIAQSPGGSIYIGTRYGGLDILKNGKFNTINIKDGLLSNGIWNIAFTENDGIWLATQSGVQKINRDNSISDELKEDMPKVPFYFICFDKKNIVFSNPTQIFLYSPLQKEKKYLCPPVFINNILVNGQKFRLKKQIELGSFQNNITFEFIEITNKEESRIYDYRLLNTQKKWSRIINRNSVTYASLEPGKYTFEVTSVDAGGNRGNKMAAVTFFIASPFYSQWWFASLVILIIVLSVASFLRYRVKRLLEIERVRTKIAEELHDEIGSGLTKIAILSEHAMIKKPADQNYASQVSEGKDQPTPVERVGTIARNLIDQMVDVIWSIDPKYDKLEDFIIHFKSYAFEVCEAGGIKLHFKTQNIEHIKLGPQTKRKLQLISSEALNNALKHSECTKIKYMLEVKNKTIYLEFSDNGKGINQSARKNGNGIRNMNKHVKELNGNIVIGPAPNGGTMISIMLPVG